MRRILLFIIFGLILSTETATAGKWLTNLEEGKKIALSTNKLIIIDFWASWCGPCRRMDSESWSDPKIQQLMQAYVPVKIDIDRNRKDSMIYNVRSIPFVFIIDGNGEVIYKSLGYMNKEEIIKVLERYALNTNFLQREAINYFQNQNYVTSLRLGEKYLDYSLYLQESIKNDFLNLAENYLKQSNKLLDKKQGNYQIIKEKLALLQLTSKLYSGDEKIVRKRLEKISLQEVDPVNHPLYAYLNLCMNKINSDPVDLQKWTKILNETPSGKKYLIRAGLFSGDKG